MNSVMDRIVPYQHDYVVDGDGVPVGVLPLTRLIFLRKGFWATTQLSSVLRWNIPKGPGRTSRSTTCSNAWRTTR